MRNIRQTGFTIVELLVVIIVISILAAVILLAAALPLHAAGSKYMSVAVQKTQVRASAGYLGAILGVLAYGELTAFERIAASA